MSARQKELSALSKSNKKLLKELHKMEQEQVSHLKILSEWRQLLENQQQIVMEGLSEMLRVSLDAHKPAEEKKGTK